MKKGISMLRMRALTIAIMTFALIACDDASQQNTSETDELESIEEKLDEVDSKRALLVESIIRSSPTLAETGEIFAEIGSDFNRDFLNDIVNVDAYSTLSAQGINLGVYMADLGYITTFEQSQEVIFYMNSAQKMAEGIGVSDVFDESTVERMEMNINDTDSIINLISELYWKTDAFLKELNRENISALIICGGWVEGMHIGSKLLEEGYDDNMIYEKFLKQHNNLKKIITLLETFEGDDRIDMFENQLGEVNQSYGDLVYEDGKIYNDEEKAQIKLVAERIESLRSEIIQP